MVHRPLSGSIKYPTILTYCNIRSHTLIIRTVLVIADDIQLEKTELIHYGVVVGIVIGVLITLSYSLEAVVPADVNMIEESIHSNLR